MKNKLFGKASILEGVLKYWVIYLLFIYVSTEALSFLKIISRSEVALLNLMFFVWLASKVWRLKKEIADVFLNRRVTFVCTVLFLLLFLILIPLLFVALYYPPNNWDSMTYHMPRVMHWIQNRSVDFYSTHNDRQLYSGPLAEYVILHWFLVFKSDIASNLVQYISLLITAVAAFLITKNLSKSSNTNILSFVLILTTPAAIMQSTSTQNDLVVASLLLSTILFGLNKSWVFFGISLGLGMLTKNTFAFFVFPFCIYFGILWLREKGIKMILWYFYFLLVIVLINFPLWSRNQSYFGFPFGSKYVSGLVLNTDHSFSGAASIIVRNIAMQLGLPKARLNKFIDRAVIDFHSLIGKDIKDIKTTHYSMIYKTEFAIHEDLSGNFLLTLLILFSLVIFLFTDRNLWFYALPIIVGFLSFSAVFKWQPWGTRLLLPWFLVAVPFVAVTIEKLLVKWRYSYQILIFALIFCALPFVAGSGKYFGRLVTSTDSNRQILPLPEFGNNDRTMRYFYAEQKTYSELVAISEEVKKRGYQKVLLDLKYDSWEYPWWVFLNNHGIAIDIYDSKIKDDSPIISDKVDCKSTVASQKQIVTSGNYCLLIKN